MKPLLHIYGASGSGTSTLGRYLAEQFQYAFLDSDDYFWLPTDPKFTTKRPIEQQRAAHTAGHCRRQKTVLSSPARSSAGGMLSSRISRWRCAL